MFPSLFAVVSPPTLIIVGLIGIILYGGKLPTMARTLAQALRAFQDSLNGREETHDELARAPAVAPVASLPRPPERLTGPSAVEKNGLASEPPLA
jgi:TatA/E family protein of Tat protein translocase